MKAAPLHPSLADIYAARRRIGQFAHHTPLIASQRLSARLDCDVRLKLENVQATGAFKVRGAANAILAAPKPARRRGIVTYSTGNHGRAAAYVARALGIQATVCVSARTVEAKISALKALGARLVVQGESQDDAMTHAHQLADTEELLLIDPINDPNTIAGHGTIGVEILEDFPGVDTVVVPVSGGALICGVALAIKAARPTARVVGVSMDRGAAMFESLKAGQPVLVEEVDSLADSLQGGILLDNHHTFAMARDLVDDFVLVSEEEIAQSLAYALRHERVVIEGAAATPIAALACHERALFGRGIVAVLTGSMIDIPVLLGVAERHGDEWTGRDD